MTSPGRPSKRTPEREERIINALAAGNTRKAACQFAGIDENTLSRWCKIGDLGDRAREAEAQAEIQAVAIIRRGIIGGDLRAAEWWLERRRADEWGRRDRVDIDLYVRQRARELGLDEDEALEAIRPRLKLVS